MDFWDVCFLIGLVAGFLIGGFVVDLFAHRQSWWRWGYAPLIAGIPGTFLCVRFAVISDDEYRGVIALYLFPFVALIPMVLAAIGVGIRRLARDWGR